jgi:hypothetical protein
LELLCVAGAIAIGWRLNRNDDNSEGELAVKKLKLAAAGLCVLVLVLTVAATPIDAQGGSFVGTWELTMTGGGHGGQGGQGGNRGGGAGAQSLTITQEGDKFKVTHRTARGESAYDATVSGSTISWTEVRQSRDGNTMNIVYKATLDGDTLKGTMGGGQFNREFTAKRSN